jgi:hypothetical protein
MEMLPFSWPLLRCRSGTFILGGTDEIQALLDDQIVKTQAMRASPYIKPLEGQANKWEAMLTTLQVCDPRLLEMIKI